MPANRRPEQPDGHRTREVGTGWAEVDEDDGLGIRRKRVTSPAAFILSPA